MTMTPRFTSADLEFFPLDDGKRYEIIAGELYVSRTPHLYHQFVCSRVWSRLDQWIAQSGNGLAIIAAGGDFPGEDEVVFGYVFSNLSPISPIFVASGGLPP